MHLQEELELQGNFLFKHRGVLPLLILLLGIISYIDYLHKLGGNKPFVFETFYAYICFVVTLFGLAIRVYTIGHALDNTSGRNIDKQIADQINTSGIYSIMRHPLYFGNFFMWLGLAILSENGWFILAFLFMFLAYYERIMFAEEQFLKRKFPNDYLAWANATPTFFPNLKSFKKPSTKFKIKKVLKQEKTGLLLVSFSYFIFDEIGFYVTRNTVSIQYNFWLFLMLFCILIYSTIKILEKKTSILK